MKKLANPTRHKGFVIKVSRRVGAYGASIALMTAINVSVIPVVILLAGPNVWGGIAVAQSIASFAFVLVAFGWGITGPSAVAGMDARLRGQYFADSVTSRAWIFVAVVPIVGAAVWSFTPGNRPANVLAALALLAPALGGSWFFVGEKRPWRLFLLENVPRAMGTLLGTLLLLIEGDILLFSSMQVLGAAVSICISWIDVTRRYPGFSWNLRLVSGIGRLRYQTAGIVTAGTAALYVNLPLVLVAFFFPRATASYAIADKLMKFALTAYAPVTQIAQGYVPHVDHGRHHRRARFAVGAAFILGLFMGVTYMLLAPAAVSLLSSGRIEIAGNLSVPLGVALFAIAASAVIGLACLTSFGASKQLATSTVLGAILGVPLLLVGGLFFGPTGIAWATAISELAVTVYQLIHFRRILRAPSFSFRKVTAIT